MKKILLIAFVAAIAFGCSQKKVVEATYQNGNPRIVKYYHKKGGELILDREVVFYENKQKKMEGEYKDLERNGQWKAWYENGTIWSEGEYKEGKRNGIGIAYHENGKKYIEGMYRDDTRVGPWRFYDTTGVLVNEVNFDLVPTATETDSIKPAEYRR
jgi:antitoxin component YwqK of YwqJK toxin-antitoxin module